MPAGRRTLLSSCAIFMLASAAHAQELKFIGIMGGIAYSWTDEIRIGGAPEAWSEPDYLTGAVAGFGIGLSSKYLSMEINGLYFQKGCRIKHFYWKYFLGYTNYRLNELSFPLLFKISPLSGTSPYFIAGYELSFILSHKRDGEDVTELTKRTDNSLIVGLGFRKKIKRHSLFIEGRYHLGLQSLSKDWDFWYLPYNRIRSFTLLAGFSI